MMEDAVSRRKRKEEGRLKKRQRIEESGGIRPRKEIENPPKNDSIHPSKSNSQHPLKKERRNKYKQFSSNHRFGRVMEKVPCRNKPRFSTVSIALPGSVLSNCQTKELRTLLVGQIARAATIYHVDEIVVFDDKLGKEYRSSYGGGKWRRVDKNDSQKEGKEENIVEEEKNEEQSDKRPRSTTQEFMARVLQYCECPQYLRRQFFPMHPDLQFTGLLAPVDAPHHVRANDHSKYREGVVLKKTSKDGGTLVNCGIRNRPVEYVKLRWEKSFIARSYFSQSPCLQN